MKGRGDLEEVICTGSESGDTKNDRPTTINASRTHGSIGRLEALRGPKRLRKSG